MSLDLLTVFITVCLIYQFSIWLLQTYIQILHLVLEFCEFKEEKSKCIVEFYEQTSIIFV